MGNISARAIIFFRTVPNAKDLKYWVQLKYALSERRGNFVSHVFRVSLKQESKSSQ
jgi:hypothetical protein